VVGLETGGGVKAYPISVLNKVLVVNDRVGAEPVLIVHQPASDTTTAFIAEANGKGLRFRAADAEANRLMDATTHSTWTAYGERVAGRLKGTHLKQLIMEPEFWFAWSEFHPKMGVIRAGEAPRALGSHAALGDERDAMTVPVRQACCQGVRYKLWWRAKKNSRKNSSKEEFRHDDSSRDERQPSSSISGFGRGRDCWTS